MLYFVRIEEPALPKRCYQSGAKSLVDDYSLRKTLKDFNWWLKLAHCEQNLLEHSP